MALNATIHKVELNVADNDRGYYGSHSLTIARHPSETDERMMVRLLAFAMYVDDTDTLTFTRGLSEVDEPDLWRHDLTGAISHWIEVGLPEERRILRACGRARQVTVLTYGRAAEVWWQGLQARVRRAPGLQILALSPETEQLAQLAERKMTLNVNIQDGSIWVSSERGEATLTAQPWDS